MSDHHHSSSNDKKERKIRRRRRRRKRKTANMHTQTHAQRNHEWYYRTNPLYLIPKMTLNTHVSPLPPHTNANQIFNSYPTVIYDNVSVQLLAIFSTWFLPFVRSFVLLHLLYACVCASLFFLLLLISLYSAQIMCSNAWSREKMRVFIFILCVCVCVVSVVMYLDRYSYKAGLRLLWLHIDITLVYTFSLSFSVFLCISLSLCSTHLYKPWIFFKPKKELAVDWVNNEHKCPKRMKEREIKIAQRKK